MSNPLRFGILGTGNIAKQFAAGVQSAKRCTLTAVGSRTQPAADAFAADYTIPAAYAPYEKLLDDNNVDAVYISFPNSMHCDWTIRCLEAGKHVLCEKPFALTVDEARRMFDASRRTGRRVMEAFMYRSHPLHRAVSERITAGDIGELKIIRTSFCYRTQKIEGNVRFDPDLGGGILLDVGCYCINFSRHFTGQEPSISFATGHQHPTGVDDGVVASMQFPNGILASFTAGMSAQADNTAHLLGTEGYIEIPIPWKPPVKQARFSIARGNPPKMDSLASTVNRPHLMPQHTFAIDAPGELYGLEADDFAAAIQDNTPFVIPESDTLGNTQVLEQMLQQIHSQWNKPR